MPYYREPNTDYMYVRPRRWTDVLYEGRAVAIQHLPSSMCTTSIHTDYLARCKRVRRKDILDAWKEWL